ncbi:hypothetical protein EDD85DRAFT_981848 [Armillaria nabsnona]|nr:hypothetical protein EDD85DRAFT_981848 [Armillaria nabsnona]
MPPPKCHRLQGSEDEVGQRTWNLLGGRMVPDNTPTVGVTAPFRSHFAIRYYINDFETAVCFCKDSDPATRKITGLPDIRVGRHVVFENNHMDVKVTGFVEKHLKVFHEDFSFDDVFGKFFAQDTIQNGQMMQVFEPRRTETGLVSTVGPVLALRKSSSQAMLFDYIGVNRSSSGMGQMVIRHFPKMSLAYRWCVRYSEFFTLVYRNGLHITTSWR